MYDSFPTPRPALPGSIIFSKLWGSRSHNTAKADSDYDYLGVYVAKTRDVLSLDKPPETVTSDKPDYQYHEAGKFAELLMKGNPGIIEMLFTEKFCYRYDTWRWLADRRREFLSAQVVKQYLGYMQGQMKRLQKGAPLHTAGGEFGEKWVYHILRLGYQALKIASGGDPIVWYEDDDPERVALMDIRKGYAYPTTVNKLINNTIEKIDGLKPWPLPAQGNKQLLNEWLWKVRGV